MPETLAGSTLAVVLLALVAGLCTLALSRWGAKVDRDPLAGAWELVTNALGRLADSAQERGRSVPVAREAAVRLGAAGAARASGLAATARAALDGLVDSMREETVPPVWEGSRVMLASGGGERRRGLFRRRREDGTAPESAGAEDPHDVEPEAPPEPAEAVDEAPGVGEPPRRRTPSRPRLNYIPLEPPERGADEDGDMETLRTRFRRGLRKTRDFLNRDVREVFGSGPVPEAFDSLEEILVRADVGVATAMALSDELRTRGRELTSDTIQQALRDAMRSQLHDADRRLRVNEDGLSVWLVVGVNGTGKTTTVAKLARHAAQQGFAVCLAAADTFRAAGIEQLETWAERVDVDIVRQHPGADPAAVVFDAIDHARARGYDLVIADTAGRLHTRTPLMDELRKVRRVVDREPGLLTETLLVLDAATGQNGIAQAKAFKEAVDITGLVLARLDGTAKGGIVVAVERELGVPVKAVGIGEKAGDLAPFDPDQFVDAIFAPDPA